MTAPHKHTRTTGLLRALRPGRSVLLTFVFFLTIVAAFSLHPRTSQAFTNSLTTVRGWLGHSAATVAVAKATATTTAFAGFVNGGFESPDIGPNFAQIDEATVPGWDTTASDNLIEFWHSGYGGVPAYEGQQFAEINATEQAVLFQDVSGLANGARVGFEVAHRGRFGVDSIRLTITDLGSDGVPGGGNDTVLFTKDYATGTAAWAFYDAQAEPAILALGNTTRFAWESLTNSSAANFLDAANFGVGVGLPPPNGPVCTNFTNRTTANGLGSNTVQSVYVLGSTVYAATAGGLAISTDGGTSFTNYTTANGLAATLSVPSS